MFAASSPFSFVAPITDLVKSGDRMLIGGFVSDESTDADGEIIVQKGLNFAPWVQEGFFNENHRQRPTEGGCLGIAVPPEEGPVRWLQKGDVSPLTGKPVNRSGWYVLGEMLDHPDGVKMFQLAESLMKKGRSLKMSIEGFARQRDPGNGKVVLAADVVNIALTPRPKNRSTVVEALRKSFADIAGTGYIDGTTLADSSWGVAYLPQIYAQPQPQFAPLVPAFYQPVVKAVMAGADVANPGTGAGVGFAYRTEDLDSKARPSTPEDKKKKAKALADQVYDTVDKAFGAAYGGKNPMSPKHTAMLASRLLNRLHKRTEECTTRSS